VKTGVQKIHNDLKRLDSGFHRNDEDPPFQIFYEIINGWITKEGFRLPSIFRERFPFKEVHPICLGVAAAGYGQDLRETE
jgi:hypothetical protein